MNRTALFLLVVVSVSATDINDKNTLECGNYSQFTPMDPFSMTKFIKNDWYMSLFSLVAEPPNRRPAKHRCYYDAYDYVTDTLDYKLLTKFIRQGSTSYSTINTSLTIQNPVVDSKWKIWNFDINSDFTYSVVLDTDYANWSLQYTCTLYGPPNPKSRVEYISAYTREREVGEEIKDYLKSRVIGYGFPSEAPMFGYMDQTDC